MHPRSIFAAVVSITLIGISSAQPEAPTEDFATVKAQRVAHLQQQLSCVEASTSFETMRACMPAGGHRGPPPGVGVP